MNKILTKVASLCLCAAMAFSVTACGDTGNSGDSGSGKQSVEIAFSETEISLLVGENETLSLTGMENQAVTYSSTNENVATVDVNGVVTAKSAGIAFIVAKIGEEEVSCKVIVSEPAVEVYSIKLNTTNVAIIQGVEYTLDAVVYLNGEETTKDVTWSNSGDNVGTFATSGNSLTLKSNAAGIATVTAMYEDVSIECKIKVMSETAERLPAVTALADGATATWDAVTGAEYYEIQIPGGAWVKTTETVYTNAALAQKYGQFDLKIRACSGNNVNYYDGEAITVQLSVELFLSIKGNTVTWTKADGATGYDVYVNDKKAVSLGSDARSYTINGNEIVKVYVLAQVNGEEKTTNQVYYSKDTGKITDILENFDEYSVDDILANTNCDVQLTDANSRSGEKALSVEVQGKTQGVSGTSAFVLKNKYGLKAGDVISYWAMPTDINYDNGSYTYSSINLGALPVPQGYSDDANTTAYGISAKSGEWTRLTYTLTAKSFDANGDLVMICRNEEIASENIQSRSGYYLDYNVYLDDIVKLSEHDGLTHTLDLNMLNNVSKGIASNDKAAVNVSTDTDGSKYATFASGATSTSTLVGYNDLFLLSLSFPGSPETKDGKQSLLVTPRANTALRNTTISFEIKTKTLESLQMFMVTCPNKNREYTATELGVANNGEWTTVSFTFDLTDIAVFCVNSTAVNEIMIRNLTYTYNNARVNVVE